MKQLMSRDEFVAAYGGIYEASPFVAERAWDGGADPATDLAPVFKRVVERAGSEAQLALLRAHPDLADRVAIGALTPDSAAEQAGAGLDQCSEAEFAEFQALNVRYKERFGFPFIIAVKGLDRAAILSAFKRRVEGEPQAEFRTALDEVHRIAGLRLAALSRPAPASKGAIAEPDLRDLVLSALARAGADAENAAAIADTVMAAERDGAQSHGIFRIPGYCAALRSGFINGGARPQRVGGPPAAVVLDGDRGATPFAYRVGLPALEKVTRDHGVGVLAVKNSRHFAAMWHEVEWLAERGLAGLACTASFPYVAPAGASRPVFGTNPLAFAYPREGAPPLVFDLATAAMARGEIMLAARDGHTVPKGAGIDRHGQDTTDPDAILNGGAQLPFGGYKGSAVALMVELLAAGVVGDLFSDESAEVSDGSGVPPGGVFVLALDPEAIGGSGTRGRAAAFLDRLAAEPGVRLPGARRHANRLKGGPLEVSASALETLRTLASAD